jgi:hypothetical protein
VTKITTTLEPIIATPAVAAAPSFVNRNGNHVGELAGATADAWLRSSPVAEVRNVPARWCILALTAAVLGGCRSAASHAEDAAPYVVNAAGRPAVVEQTIKLTWPGRAGAGLILNAEICGDTAYLLAPALKYVHVGRLKSGIVDRQIGKPGNGPEDLRRPVSLGADCAAQRVFVVEGKGGVLAFNARDGQFERAYPHAAEFRSSMGTRTQISTDGARLILSGLWSPVAGRSWAPGANMFEHHQLGLLLPIGDPSGHPVAKAYERDCATDLTSCLRVDLQPLDGSGGWVVAQGGSTRIAVLDSSGDVAKTIDVRSPEFHRDGTTPDQTTEAQLKWGTTNNTIWGLYAIGDRIAVIHARNATRNWQRGQVMQFDVFMNIFGLNGARLVSDLRLPGLPVGRDGNDILVIDYGSQGRRGDATEVALVRVPIRNAGDFGPQ